MNKAKPKTAVSKDDLFLWLCKETADIPYGYDPKIYSVPMMACYLNTTKYSIRKLVKQLETEGLVHKTYIGGMNEDGEIGCYHGWSLSDAARETETYKQCEITALDEFSRELGGTDDD